MQLVESVRSLLTYLEAAPQRSSRTSPRKRREQQQQQPQPATAADAQQLQQQSMYYTSGQLQHLHALHSLALFSKLIVYRNGRALFPLALSRSGGSEGYALAFFLISYKLSLTSQLNIALKFCRMLFSIKFFKSCNLHELPIIINSKLYRILTE